LYTGRIHPEKGIHLLVKAARLLTTKFENVRLKIIGAMSVEQGGGGDEYLAKLRKEGEGLAVEYCDAIYDRQQLASELRSADYYCYPSLAEKGESFGVAPLEAMACGLVPVVSDLACFRDFVDHGKNGFIFDHRAADPVVTLSESLEAVMSLPDERRAAMRLAAATTASRFSLADVATQYLSDFEELLGAS
jgi:glycosyltransferase involved in cell wall biosynthesis